MSTLNTRLGRLETTAGLGLSAQEQFNREANSHSDVELLAVYRWLKAQIAGTTPPAVSDDTVALAHRLVGLMPAAD